MEWACLLALALWPVVTLAQEVTSDREGPSEGASSLMCYTCMSENVPPISKEIMRQTINLPDYAQSRACNDPFGRDPEALRSGRIRLEPCQTACIKVVSENKYLKVVLRGCLNKLYNPGYLGFPLPDSVSGSYRDVCDLQRQDSSGIGQTTTNTCICTEHNCNGSHGLRASAALLLALPVAALGLRVML